MGIIIKIQTRDMPYYQLENLEDLFSAKGPLIAQSFMLPALPMEYDDNGDLILRWFEDREVENPKLAVDFIKIIVDYIKAGHKVSSPEPVAMDNPKYTFKNFLYQLGIKAPKYKEMRAALLEHMEGSVNRYWSARPKKNKVYVIK